MTAQRITLGELAAVVLAELGDTEETIWSRTQDIEPWIVDTMSDFTTRTLLLWDRQPLPDVDGQGTYSIPADYWFHQLDRAEWDYQVVHPKFPRELMATQGLFESTGNRPLNLLMDGEGLDVVRKIGVPNEDSNKFFIEYFTVGFDPDIESEDLITIPIRYLLGPVASGVKAKAYARDGDGQSIALSEFWNSVYEDGVDMVTQRRETFFRRRISNIGTDGRVASGSRRRDPGSLPPYFPAIK